MMTSQIPDEVLFEQEWFVVTAVDGTGLFAPAEHGLEPECFSTACYRGHVCRYAVVDGRLELHDLELGSEQAPPRLGGRPPVAIEPWQWHYEGLAVPTAFTGRLLIGNGDPDELPYLHMGFRPAWMFAEVRELTFEAGALQAAADRSAELARVRTDVAPTAARPAPGEPTEEWISRTFSLTFEYAWPGRS
ncbi:hypothetical protein [Pseudonocardia sp. TRM90224]|uniref:hypothetical protein n=1 Tax=Pseudonocardia sp. TRM90224 TaxID=2812678 RepID=UPI001E3EE438|nr:hypothetical protein [Pseudonocardia sp. TRM90224]